MSNQVATMQHDSVKNELVYQTSSNGAADVNVVGGQCAIDNTIPGVTNAVTLSVNPISSSSPNNSTSTVYVASQQVKASPGILYGVIGYNSKASAQFVQVFDSVGLPAEGAIPKIVITVAATANYSIDFGVFGRWFNNGIYICNSSTGPTKTIGSADIWLDASFK
jgi:hypothetical protein